MKETRDKNPTLCGAAELPTARRPPTRVAFRRRGIAAIPAMLDLIVSAAGGGRASDGLGAMWRSAFRDGRVPLVVDLSVDVAFLALVAAAIIVAVSRQDVGM